MKRNTIAKSCVIAAVTALALGLAPIANADDKGCSNATLKGTFATQVTGVLISPATMAGPLANVGTETFDGNGGMTGAGIQNLNGNIIPITQTGTYKVNPDCTGTYTVQVSPLGIAAHVFFVIDNTVNELQVIGTDSGVVISGTARRQFPVGDWRQ